MTLASKRRNKKEYPMNKGMIRIVEFILGVFVRKQNITDVGRLIGLMAKIMIQANVRRSAKSLKYRRGRELLRDTLPFLPLLDTFRTFCWNRIRQELMNLERMNPLFAALWIDQECNSLVN